MTKGPEQNRDAQLWSFDEATLRQLQRQVDRQLSTPGDRGWSREELYEAREWTDHGDA